MAIGGGVILLDFSCTPETQPDPLDVFTASRAVPDLWPSTREGEEVLFTRNQLRTVDGSLLAEETQGQLTDAIFQRSARPWTHFSEPFLYNEEIEAVEQPNGEVLHHYRITREPNPRRVFPGVRASDTPEITEELQDLIDESDPDARIVISARLADVPEWDIPLIPPPELVGSAVHRAALDARERAFERRRNLLRQAQTAVEEELREVDGLVEAQSGQSAWIRLDVPARAVESMSQSTRFTKLMVPHDEVQSNQVCNQGCWTLKDQQNVGNPLWYLGEAGPQARLNSDAHHAFGYEGDIANTQWHGTIYNRLLLGVIDLSSLEDESPAFSDRIFGRWNCERYCTGWVNPLTGGCWNGHWDGRCLSTTNFNDTEGVTCPVHSSCSNAGYHGTSVSGIALANYDHAGSSGLQLGDECYSTPNYSVHCDTWKQRSQGLAPQAGLMYLRLTNTADYVWESAINRAIEQKVDVLNISVGDGTRDYENRCNLTLNTAYEDNLENAFNDGIFVVNSSGNFVDEESQYGFFDCLINSMSSKPKVFSVASVLIDGALNYNSMDRHVAGSYAGGANVRINGAPLTTNRPVSIVDLLAPSSGHLVTTCNGTNGMTEDISLFGGSSGAAPHVAGAALLVKHRLLANGQTWVNSPGRLHTVMLAMGDRAISFNPIVTPRLVGTDNLWGMGRLKLSMFPTYFMQTRSFTASSTTPVRKRIFTNGMQANRKFVKCVFLQDEDMSSKSLDDQVSRIRLRLIVVPRPPEQAGQTCPDQPANLNGPIVLDDSLDIKKMVTAMSLDLGQYFVYPNPGLSGLPNACVYIEHTPLHVTPQAITTHTFCYQSEVRDDQGI
ncbi:MAG: hypothetical protein CVU65_16305 [Deltaproteobacteria bacterium HGW-Deltaproteobacteria-22]|nr:MAG: hypothetical protein CVU65_16305 [Deltaproteobacteria bacterium HGW-Deltaproteobacteria-22]